ncbi:MAG: DUF2459 domain-containing protein [Gammaproteobacteria bacterium]|nr:DUF2459 domain-containing protein [Gammaproteobacteria bacterium]
MFKGRKRFIHHEWLLKVVVVLLALLPSISFANSVTDATPKVPIYLVSHGWHAGIVLERQLLSEYIEVLQQDFANAEYLEIGWGDSDFYQTPDPHIGLILKAGLLPSESVLHLVGFNGDVTHYFPYSEIIELKVTPEQLDELVINIAASFTMDGKGKTVSLGRGLYGDSRFYSSKESYHIFNTCNVWTARALRRAGLDTHPLSAITVDDLMGQLRGVGRVVQQMAVTEGGNLDNSEGSND